MSEMNDLLRRQRIVGACANLHLGRPFKWGVRECVRLARLAMIEGGHGCPLLKGKKYTTALGAARVMKRSGFESLVQAMDATGLARIAPARALPGDIVALPTDAPGPWGCALSVAMGNGAFLAYWGAEESSWCGAAVRDLEPMAAWRV